MLWVDFTMIRIIYVGEKIEINRFKRFFSLSIHFPEEQFYICVEKLQRKSLIDILY